MIYTYSCEPRKEDREIVLLGTAAKHKLSIDEWLWESGDQYELPFTQRRLGFALDQRLIAGDVVLISASDFDSGCDHTDTCLGWHRSGVRVIEVQESNHHMLRVLKKMRAAFDQPA